MAKPNEKIISKWYDGRSIFITGATGFMGKVLVEKLLYSCTGLEKIYILLRTKRGRTPEQRIEDMWKLPLFNRLRETNPDAIKKISAINGELLMENLGLNTSDRKKLTDNVSVIFHMAATLKLEAELKDAVEMNTKGTYKVIELAKQMKNLKAFIHLSTAFCCCDIEHLEEKVYSTNDNPHDVIRMVEWMKNDAINAATPDLIRPHPQTYTYTKRLAENLVADEYPKMPIAIARPSIVTAAYEEPVSGWVDSLNGPVGLLVGAGKGVIRTMHCQPNYHAQVVPVDLAINGLIAIGWKTGSTEQKPKDIPVYNMTQDGVKRVTWKEVLDKGRKAMYEYPFEGTIWYPDGDMRSSKFLHDIRVLFLHLLPAYFIDFLLLIFRQKRFMVRLQKRISQGLELLHFFTNREWSFASENFLSLERNMTPADKKDFPIDFDIIDTDDYLRITILGARQYCMKEPLSSLPYCRVKQKFLYVLDKALVFFIYYTIITTIISYSDTAKTTLNFVGDYVRDIPYVGYFVPVF